MNALQKEQVRRLQGEGYGYKKIASMLELSENTVKSFCRRNRRATEPGREGRPTERPISIISPDVCRECGGRIYNTPGHRQRKFCSDICRKLYWRRNQGMINRRSAVRSCCPVCGEDFSDYAGKKRKYCSRDCYIKARYKGGDGDE